MKTIGLIGGMSWTSSLEYYRILNELIKEKLGGLHSAKLIMYSVDFEEVESSMKNNDWTKIASIIMECAKKIEKAGAEFFLICTNTIHKVAEAVEKKVKMPLLHIADATAEKIKKQNMKKVGLLGTRFTMEEDFYKKRLNEKHRIQVVIPNPEEREVVDRIIFDELCLDEIKEPSKVKCVNIIKNLVNDGAEGIVLGCTELPLLIKENDVEIPLFNTTEIHASSAVDFALK